LYANVIEQLTLLSLAAILTIDIAPHVDAVVFNGVVAARDPRSGQPIRPCLVTLRATPAAFAEIDMANGDPGACLHRLAATVSQNPAELVPVRPLPQ
jgi:restriction system protein